MNYGKIAVSLLAAVSFACTWAGSAATVDAWAQKKPVKIETDWGHSRIYETIGWRVAVPYAYDSQLMKEMPMKADGTFFVVSEKASIEAAAKKGEAYDGAGWLFSLGYVSEERLHTILCEDMSGAELFAHDGRGNYFIFYHPTDVRFVRANAWVMEREQEVWTNLNTWAVSDVRKTFLELNAGLKKLTADNSDVGICLAKIMYQPDTEYTISKDGKAVVPSKKFSPVPYMEKLLYGASYEMLKKKKFPSEGYVRLTLPREGVSLDFFTDESGKTFVRKVRQGSKDIVYRAYFEDENIRAEEILANCQRAMAE